MAALNTRVANVAFVRPELEALLPQYRLIRDCLEGETRVKACGELYLPMPNAEDKSPKNLERYRAYKTRAQFFNATRRTLEGLIGQVFMREPEIELPKLLESVKADATGSGVSLVQDCRAALEYTLAYSRAGVLVDVPEAPKGGATAEQVQKGEFRPTINSYEPNAIINWRVVERGARLLLSLVVLHESYVVEDDGFETKLASQFRVLKLVNDQYVQEIWRDKTHARYNKNWNRRIEGNFTLHRSIVPQGPDGNPLTEIPFRFTGTKNNDPNPESPNFYDLASLNIGHYRNSADYEESAFVVGQPTLAIIGLTADWLKNQLEGKVNFGSRGGIPLPQGADAKLLEASPNTLPGEAMERKERQMVALGAKLVEQKTVQRTAFETNVDKTSEGSTLSNAAANVEETYNWALRLCAYFLGQPDTGIKFVLNKDFNIATLSTEEQKAAVTNWQAGALTFGEMRAVLRKAGSATENDDTAKAEIKADQVDELATVAKFENAPTPGE
jgi:hypothetical protein